MKIIKQGKVVVFVAFWVLFGAAFLGSVIMAVTLYAKNI